MTIKNDASLRGKSKALAQRYGLSAQEVTQMQKFTRFLNGNYLFFRVHTFAPFGVKFSIG